MNKIAVAFSIAGLACLILFQNCSRGAVTPSSTQLSKGIEKTPTSGIQIANDSQVIDQSAQYTQIIFSQPDSRYENNGIHTLKLSVDLLKGTMELQPMYGAKASASDPSVSCLLDDVRLQNLNSLLSTSRICKSAELKSGEVACMAIAVSDIQLLNPAANSMTELRADICHSGIFLCDGDDERFRALLKDVVASSAAACK